MKQSFRYHCLPLSIILVAVASFAQHLDSYSPFFAACSLSSDTCHYIALRSFRQAGVRGLFIVKPATLATQIVPADSACCAPAALADLRGLFAQTAYAAALDSSEKSERRVQDAGLVRGSPGRKGIDLTADLCPSRLPLARDFFTGLIDQFLPTERPVPVALAVTGVWMNTHQDDLEWLVDLGKKGDLSITWINHSYNHLISDSVPVEKNFLLRKGTNLEAEVLKTEQKMIESGITPSVFFRFPGLVSDSLVFAKVTSFGLIPVGSDAWLAKNELPKNGSIVLVHANGNEPYGIKQFFKLIRQERDSISAGKWMLYDLRESVAENEKK
ncbi:MAG TPA: hypothetical protein VLX68_13290 [Chitinivibrionales bacterium]|nr:hypothetical protein [Chitinivibrionales bacterium]